MDHVIAFVMVKVLQPIVITIYITKRQDQFLQLVNEVLLFIGGSLSYRVSIIHIFFKQSFNSGNASPLLISIIYQEVVHVLQKLTHLRSRVCLVYVGWSTPEEFHDAGVIVFGLWVETLVFVFVHMVV